MLGSIVEAIKGLFRPVFRVTEAGETVIARTPTIYDVDVIDRAQQFTRNIAETVIPPTSFTLLLSATDRPIHVRYCAVNGLTNATMAGWQIADRPGVQSDEISCLEEALAAGYIQYYPIITADMGIIIPRGKNFYGVMYVAAGGARSCRYQIQYVRL